MYVCESERCMLQTEGMGIGEERNCSVYVYFNKVVRVERE